MANDENQNDKPKDETETETETKDPKDTPKDTPKETPKGKTYTKDEVEAMIQKRLDREREAAEKRASIEKLEGEDKLKAQYEMDREALTKERDEAQQALKVANATVELTKAGLAPEFAPYVIGDSDDTTSENIKRLSELVKAQVQAEVASKMKRGAPKVPGDAPAETENQRIKAQIYAAAGVKPRA